MTTPEHTRSHVEFGADGIRGIAGQWPLTPQGALQIGCALGGFVRSRAQHAVVVMGRDTRPSGEFLTRSLVEGLLMQHVDVLDLGVMTTPGVAYLTRREDADLGIVVSASHNPVEYNGIKLIGPHGLRLQREDEFQVESLCRELETYPAIPVASKGQYTKATQLVELYIEDHVRRCPVESLAGLKLVLDCANGAATRVAPQAFQRRGAKVYVINDDMTGDNINLACGSEHTRHYPQDLCALVRQHHAQYGFAFDGDGDRLVVVDATGNMYDGDDLLFVLATYFQSGNGLRGNAVVTTHAGNSGLETGLLRHRIRTIYTGKGDKSLEAEMWHGDYLLGGEQTGNMILNDGHHTAADAIYTGLMLAGILVCEPKLSLAERVADFVRLPQVIASLAVLEKPPLDSIWELQEETRRGSKALGARCRIATWYSSTEPDLFRVMVEGTESCSLGVVTHVASSLCQVMQRATRSEASNVVMLTVSSRLRV